MFDISGKLRHRVTFERWDGITSDSWLPFQSDVPAHVAARNASGTSGASVNVNGSTRVAQIFTFRSKSVAAITDHFRFTSGGLTYLIETIEPGFEYRGSTVMTARAWPLTHSLLIQRRPTAGGVNGAVLSVDGLGQTLKAWVDHWPCWGSAHPGAGSESATADVRRAESDVRFRIKYKPGLDETMRVVWRGVSHDIISLADVDGEAKWLDIRAKAGGKEVPQ